MPNRGASGRDRGLRAAWSSADLRLLLIAQASSTGTQYLVTTALAVHLVKVLGPDGLLLLSLRYLPAALLGPLSAAPTDVLGARSALLTLFAGRTLVIGAIASMLAAGVPVGPIMGLALVEAALGTASVPAIAFVHVAAARSPAELSAASAMTSNVKSVFEILGALVGGFLSALVAPPVVFAVAAGVATVGAAVALGLRAGRSRGERGSIASLRDRFVRDWRMLREPKILPTVALAAARASNRAVWVGLSVIAATGFLKMGTAGVGDLLTAAGIGTAISLPVGARVLRRAGLATALAATVAGMGVSFVLIAVTGDAAAALVLIVLWSLSSAIADVSVGILIPRVAARRVANAVSLNETMRNWAQAVGIALVPVSVTLFGARGATAAWGVAMLFTAVVARPAVRRLDTNVEAHMKMFERVRSVDLFRPLHLVEQEQVVSALAPRRVRSGEILTREGDRDARSMSIIDNGTVEITIRGEPIRELGAGDSFGEIALLHKVPRTATATASSDGTILELDREAFIGAVSDYHAGEEALPQEPSVASGPIELIDALRGMPLLAGIDARALEALRDAAIIRAVRPGEVLCAEGEEADSVFVMLDGNANVLVGDEQVSRVGPGQTFGEIGVMHGVRRTATVTASDHGLLAELPVPALSAAIGQAPTVGGLFRRDE